VARHARPGRQHRLSGPVLGLLASGAAALLALPAAAALSSLPAPSPGDVSLPGVARPVSVTDVSDGAEDSIPPSTPRRLVIDALGLDADVETVNLAGDGTLATPRDVLHVGWYAQSSLPGELGPAVIVGHVDSADGPAVFARLGELETGDSVTVVGADGSSISYTVSSVTRHPKESFPIEAVYGGSPEASLRLITCGGPFERGTGYTANVVVAAVAKEVA